MPVNVCVHSIARVMACLRVCLNLKVCVCVRVILILG